MAKSGEVSLLIEGQVFKVNKEKLCEYSDYFRAMFSGNFSEQEKQEISIDVVDATSMSIIIKYMKMGFLDLYNYPLPTIGELAISANFLQITELIKQIEYCLDINLSAANWVETMSIAENASYSKLEKRAAAYGLYQFKLMKPEYIPPVEKLVWYLSHSYLHAESELQVFEFGAEWITLKEAGADALLLVLGCLDMSRLTVADLTKMKDLIADYVNSLAEKVVYCLHKLATDFEISATQITNNKTVLCEMFTERVYVETLSLVTDSKKRELKFQPCVALWAKDKRELKFQPCMDSWAKDKHQDKSTSIPSNYLYTFNETNGFTQWLEVAEPDLWGWNVLAWGPTRIVIVCGEHGRGTGFFWRGVKVYDILRKEWFEHGVDLPVRRHGGVAIVEDDLYIIGGVGGYRIQLDNVVIYNLKQQTFRKVASFPDVIQKPAICVHDNVVYAAGHKNIYRYDSADNHDRWITVLETNIKPSCMVSYRGYIYCTQNYFVNFYRFRPCVDTTLELFTCFSNPPATVCRLGDKLLAFTSTNGTQDDMITVEEYKENSKEETPNIVWFKKNCVFAINDVSGSCAVVDTMPPVKNEFTAYLKRTLANYEACYPN